MTSTVRVAWSQEFDNGQKWNEVCAWAVERFGLPGDRFTTHANLNHMDFVFESNKDALMMAIMWNARIIPDNDLAVEFVGRCMQ
mgnify:CR=1 FL=1|jgi:hypothetical protein